jgi:hypothetical protein
VDEYVVDWWGIQRAQQDAAKLITSRRWVKLLDDSDELGEWWQPAVKGPSALCCLETRKDGGICARAAGTGTDHPGTGRCSAHGGKNEHETMVGAWVVAHAYAKELECTPWEALLKVVKIAAGKVAYCKYKLGDADNDEDLEPGGRLYYWVTLEERWVVNLAKMAQVAINAGVAERLVRQVELEGQLMVRAAQLTFTEMGLDDDRITTAMQLMAKHVLELESKVNDHDIVDITELRSIERGV